MFDTELQEFRTIVDPSGLMVAVYKIGGGTVGKSYDGLWAALVWEPTSPTTPLLQTDSLYVGTPKDHCQVAELAASFAEAI